MTDQVFKLNLPPDQIRDMAQTLKEYAESILKDEPDNENAFMAIKFYEDIIKLVEQVRPVESPNILPIILYPNKYQS